jgi:hypothetical protein
MEFKSPYLIGNVCPNLIMLVLHDFLKAHLELQFIHDGLIFHIIYTYPIH